MRRLDGTGTGVGASIRQLPQSAISSAISSARARGGLRIPDCALLHEQFIHLLRLFFQVLALLSNKALKPGPLLVQLPELCLLCPLLPLIAKSPLRAHAHGSPSLEYNVPKGERVWLLRWQGDLVPRMPHIWQHALIATCVAARAP